MNPNVLAADVDVLILDELFILGFINLFPYEANLLGLIILLSNVTRLLKLYCLNL